MKLYFLFLLICLNSCKAQHTVTTKNDIMIPQIDNKFETFDIEVFNKENIRGRQDKKTNEKYIIKTSSKAGYSNVIYYNDLTFSITKNYYPNGNIEIKGISFNNGSEYGIWYEFDKQGKLIKEVNTDEGFTYGWQKVIKYCEDNKIPLTKGYQKGGSQTEIYKQDFENKRVWEITYLETIDGFPYYIEIILDGQTGELLNKKQTEFE